jgi:ATP-dependent Lon protease
MIAAFVDRDWLLKLRKRNFTETPHHFGLGSHLNARDRKVVRPTVSGLMKLLYSNGQVTKEELAERVAFAMEGRRVKDQLKKMGSFEDYHPSFGYLDNESGEEILVGVPEQGGRDVISSDPLPPTTLWTVSVIGDGTVGLYRVEVSQSFGIGKLKHVGVSSAMKASAQRAFSYLQAQKTPFGVARELDTPDLHVEVIDLVWNRVEAQLGVALSIAAYLILRKSQPQAGLLVFDDMSVQGNIKAVCSLTEPLQVAMGNRAKRVLAAIENKRQFLEVNADVLEAVVPIFHSDVRQAAFNALGLA